MDDLDEKIKAVEPLLQQALVALRRYRKALGSAPPEEVERLGLEAVSLMQTVQAYQQRDWELGCKGRTAASQVSDYTQVD